MILDTHFGFSGVFRGGDKLALVQAIATLYIPSPQPPTFRRIGPLH